MATYTYRCAECGLTADHSRAIDERDRAPYCPACYDGQRMPVMRRLLAAPAVAFRGTGFYCTDNRPAR